MKLWIRFQLCKVKQPHGEEETSVERRAKARTLTDKIVHDIWDTFSIDGMKYYIDIAQDKDIYTLLEQQMLISCLDRDDPAF
jgi:hypothetical protein